MDRGDTKERKKDGPDPLYDRVVTQEITPLTPLETTDRPTDRPRTVRSSGRRSGVRTDAPTDRFRGADYTRRRDEHRRRTDGKARKREDINLDARRHRGIR